MKVVIRVAAVVLGDPLRPCAFFVVYCLRLNQAALVQLHQAPRLQTRNHCQNQRSHYRSLPQVL